FLGEYRDLFLMEDPAQELTPTQEVRDSMGMTHIRFQQHSGGVPIRGAELIVHLDASGGVIAVNGRYVPRLAGFGVSPSLSSSTARDVAFADAQQILPNLDLSQLRRYPTPRLIIVAEDPSTPTLAYEIRLDVMGSRLARFVYLIDAANGRVVNKY